MGNEMELHQVIYTSLLTQIQFGVYRYAESLPTMEEAGRQFHMAVDTVSPAYHRLRQEGYISLSKKAGAKVAVQYGQLEIERNVQSFFAARKTALTDLSLSIRPLLGQALWFSLKHAPLEAMDCAEQIFLENAQAPFSVWRCPEQKYAALGNGLLLRLARHISLFFQEPFFSVAENKQLLEGSTCFVQTVTDLRRREDWDTLHCVLKFAQDGLCTALRRFLDEKITQPPPEKEVTFRWNAYKKSSQLRFSLAMDLLIDISRGIYPVGSYLPTAGRLAAERGVSVSTTRRAVSLLGSIGAVKSSRPFGACVLPPAQSTENCDFTQPDIQNRLLDMVESLQLLALSCRSVAEVTLNSLHAASLQKWKQRLTAVKKMRHYELVTYVSLELISKYAPLQTIRTIYSELVRVLFWGNALRGMRDSTDATNAVFEPYFDFLIGSLNGPDTEGFSAKLEELMLYELHVTVKQLLHLGIREAGAILIPDKNEMPACLK